jgi:hypothetical protein
MRPIARLLFPEVMGYDTQIFGFSINYQPNTDASTVTLNININLPEEEFTRFSLDFFDQTTSQTYELIFKAGNALIHRGNVAHAAKPIISGERTNLVLCLYGNNGRLPPQSAKRVAVDYCKRWTVPTAVHDEFTPF